MTLVPWIPFLLSESERENETTVALYVLRNPLKNISSFETMLDRGEVWRNWH